MRDWHQPLARRGAGLKSTAVLACAILGLLSIKGLRTPQEIVWGLSAVAALSFLAGIPPLIFWRRSLLALPFCLVAFPLLFTHPGPPVAELFGWGISAGGLSQVAVIGGQCLLCFQVMQLAVCLKGPYELVEAVARLGCPSRLVDVLRLCLRYLGLVMEELGRLRRARQSRARKEPGLLFRARVTGNLVATLFLRSLERAERVELAMKSRGAQRGLRLSSSSPSPWGVAEFVLLGLTLTGLVGAWWNDWPW